MTESKDISNGIKITREILESMLLGKIRKISDKKYKKNGSELFWSFLSENHKSSRIFQNASEKYIINLFQKYNRVKILGMTDSLPLKELYVQAYVLDDIRSRNLSTEKELKSELYNFKEKNLTNYSAFGNRKEAIEIVQEKNELNSDQNFILLGKPGSGKSTFLKYVALESIRSDDTLVNKKIPVIVSFRSYIDSDKSLLDFITSEFDICEFDEPKKIVLELLESGSLLILLDGLDEVGTSNQLFEAINNLKSISDQYYRNQFIVSCRTASYFNWFENFSDVEIADFDEKQSQNFADCFFKNKDYDTSELKRKIKYDDSINELSTSPLLLTFLCIYFQGNSKLTTNRSDLYQEAIEVLLKRWDSTRGFRRDRLYPEFTERHEINLLSEFAYNNFVQGVYFFKKNSISTDFESYLREKIGINDADGNELLKDIESSHSLIFERQRNIYSFAHLTIQEYFTAKYIYDNSLNGKLDEAFENYISLPEWREVFLVLFNMANNESTVNYMLSGIKKIIVNISAQEPKIIELWKRISTKDAFTSFENNYTLFLCALDKAEATSRKNYQMLFETYSSIFKILKIDYQDPRILARSGIDLETAEVIKPIYQDIKSINEDKMAEYSIALLRLIECLKEVDILSNKSVTRKTLETLEIFIPYQENNNE